LAPFPSVHLSPRSFWCFGAGALSGLMACASPSPEPDPAQPAPTELGTLPFAYTNADGDEPSAQAWFPTYTTGNPIAKYDFATFGGSQQDATPACDAPLPVVVFSHGNTGMRYQSVFLMEALAQRGFLVLAPDHAGNTAFDDTMDRAEVAYRRPLDVMATFDTAAAHPQLADCIDPAAGYAIMGHSFGGWTTFMLAGATLDFELLQAQCDTSSTLLCDLSQPPPNLHDPRVWGAIALAPLGGHSIGEAGTGSIEVPTVVVAALQDRTTPSPEHADPLYEGLDEGLRSYVGLDRIGHYSFGDPCLYLDDGCGPDFLPQDEAQGLIGQIVGDLLEQLASGAVPTLTPSEGLLTAPPAAN